MNSPCIAGFDRVLLRELADGVGKIFQNAEALYQEAKILGAAGAISRALFLHQISLEECAKIETVCWWATSLLAGLPVNQKKVVEGFASHALKNQTNAYMLEGSEQEQAAKARGDWKAALQEFKKLQAEFHQKSNDAKNSALYVDFKDVKFIAPVDRITHTMLAETAARNKTFLGEAYPKIRWLSKLTQAPEQTREQIIAFQNVIKAAKNPNEAMASLRMLIDELAAIERAKGAAKPKSD